MAGLPIADRTGASVALAAPPSSRRGGAVVPARVEPPPEPEPGADTRILVAGATGLQGGAVARRCLALGFTVAGLTRTPDSAQAQELAALGVTVVKGDMDDPLALDRALAIASGAPSGHHPTPGALYGVFGVQNYWMPAPSVDREVQQGRNLIDAAKRAGVRHFIYSSIGGCTQEAGPFRRRGGTGIPQFESKRRIEEHLKDSGLRYTILRPSFLMDNFWTDVTPWAHPETHVTMPAHPSTVQQMVRAAAARPQAAAQLTQAACCTQVWSDDIGALSAKAFQQSEPDQATDPWLERELEVAGDALTGAQIAAVFSIVTGRHMKYRQGPPAALLRCFSREAYMQTKYIDKVGFCANVGECRKLLPSMHTLEAALRANNWEGRPSDDFQQSLLCDCHTCAAPALPPCVARRSPARAARRQARHVPLHSRVPMLRHGLGGAEHGAQRAALGARVAGRLPVRERRAAHACPAAVRHGGLLPAGLVQRAVLPALRRRAAGGRGPLPPQGGAGHGPRLRVLMAAPGAVVSGINGISGTPLVHM